MGYSDIYWELLALCLLELEHCKEVDFHTTTSPFDRLCKTMLIINQTMYQARMFYLQGLDSRLPIEEYSQIEIFLRNFMFSMKKMKTFMWPLFALEAQGLDPNPIRQAFTSWKATEIRTKHIDQPCCL